MRWIAGLAALLVGCGAASATTVTIELPGNETPQIAKLTYACGERRVTATYINTEANQFAVLNLGDATVAMVTVLSGSGARYAGQQYEWWTKGEEATLTDLRTDAQSPLACKAIM
jgi:membrane-bound inhibitor of C-type lysozyme